MLGKFNGARGAYTIRLAGPDEAAILAHHRAAMFRDMGEVDPQGAAIIANASDDHLAALIEGREYFGFLAEFERTVARAIMGAIIEWSPEQRVARITPHASRQGQPLYESLGFETSTEMRLRLV